MKCKMDILILYKFIAIYIVFNKTKNIVVSLIKQYMSTIYMCPDILLKFDKCWCIQSGNIDPLTNTLKIWYNMMSHISVMVAAIDL